MSADISEVKIYCGFTPKNHHSSRNIGKIVEKNYNETEVKKERVNVNETDVRKAEKE